MRASPLSRTRIAQLIADGRVTVNGEATRKGYVPSPGIASKWNCRRRPDPAGAGRHPRRDQVRGRAPGRGREPAGLVVHPAPGHPRGTLVNALLFHLDRLSSIGGDSRPGIVHRLDRDTSGLMLVAKRDEAHRELSAALQRREIERGTSRPPGGISIANGSRWINRSDATARRTRMAVREDGRPATTTSGASSAGTPRSSSRYDSARGGRTRCAYTSGRSPSRRRRSGLRAELGARVRRGGRPLGGGVRAPGGRLFLHATHLACEHPVTGEELSFSSPCPRRYWRRWSGHVRPHDPVWILCSPVGATLGFARGCQDARMNTGKTRTEDETHARPRAPVRARQLRGVRARADVHRDRVRAARPGIGDGRAAPPRARLRRAPSGRTHPRLRRLG